MTALSSGKVVPHCLLLEGWRLTGQVEEFDRNTWKQVVWSRGSWRERVRQVPAEVRRLQGPEARKAESTGIGSPGSQASKWPWTT